MKTYLVTGAAGFICANYLKYILAKHDDIRVVVLDLVPSEKLDEIFDPWGFLTRIDRVFDRLEELDFSA